MRVLMTTTGYAGHALPMVPFARALMRAGAEVQMVGPRSRGHLLTRLGIPYFGIYDSPEEAILRVGISTFDMPFKRANGRVVATGFGNLEARAAAASVLDTVDAWRPDVVIRESYEFASIIATELRSIPRCCVSLGLDDTERWIAERVSDPLAVLRADHGLPKEPQVPPEPYLTLMPEELEAPGAPFAIARLRFCDPEPAGEPFSEPSWTASGHPLVYVSFGTVAAEIGLFPELYRAAALALADLPVRVVMTVGEKHAPRDLGPLPCNVRVERWIPQDHVLAHAALMVSHPGYGAMMGALSRGVPMVVMPLFTDDHYRNASRIRATGAGVVLPGLPDLHTLLAAGPDALRANLAGAVQRVLADSSFKSASAGIARQFTVLPSIDRVASFLLELVRHAGGGANKRLH